MPGSRRRWLLAVVGVVAIAAALATARPLVLGPAALRSNNDGFEKTTVHAKVGEHETFYAGNFYPRGSRPVRVRSVRLTDLPRGLRVVGIWGIEGGQDGGGLNGDPEPEIRGRLRPVTDMVYKPGAPREEWQLVITLAATEPGEWVSSGIAIDWSAGWRRGTAHYTYRFGIEATA